MYNMTTKNSNKYAPIQWIHSIGTNNMCGFSSFDLPIQKLIYNGYTSHENPFIHMYMQALETNCFNFRDKDLRAAAIKQAFVDSMRADNFGVTPFDTIMELVSVEFLQPGQSNLQDYSDFIKPFIRENEEEMRALHVKYKQQIDVQAQYDNFDREVRYNEGAIFFNFLKLESPGFVARAKEAYCSELIKPENNYRARDIDMLYIAQQIGCFGKVSIHDHSGYMHGTTVYSLPAENNLELHLKNTGNHWVAGDLPLPAPAPAPAQAQVNTENNYAQYIAENCLLVLFGSSLQSQPRFKEFLNVNNSELRNISAQGDEFLTRTIHANELLDKGDAASITELITLFDFVEHNQKISKFSKL